MVFSLAARIPVVTTKRGASKGVTRELQQQPGCGPAAQKGSEPGESLARGKDPMEAQCTSARCYPSYPDIVCRGSSSKQQEVWNYLIPNPQHFREVSVIPICSPSAWPPRWSNCSPLAPDCRFVRRPGDRDALPIARKRPGVLGRDGAAALSRTASGRGSTVGRWRGRTSCWHTATPWPWSGHRRRGRLAGSLQEGREMGPSESRAFDAGAAVPWAGAAALRAFGPWGRVSRERDEIPRRERGGPDDWQPWSAIQAVALLGAWGLDGLRPRALPGPVPRRRGGASPAGAVRALGADRHRGAHHRSGRGRSNLDRRQWHPNLLRRLAVCLHGGYRQAGISGSHARRAPGPGPRP